MSKNVLVKQSGPSVFQTVGPQKDRPSFMDMARTTFAPRDGRVTGNQRALGLIGMAGKVGAAAATAQQTAERMQSGDASAPLQAGITYQGIDPTGTINPNIGQDLARRTPAPAPTPNNQAPKVGVQAPVMPPAHQQQYTPEGNPIPKPDNTGGGRYNTNVAVTAPTPAAPAPTPAAPAPTPAAPASQGPNYSAMANVVNQQPVPQQPVVVQPVGVSQVPLPGQTLTQQQMKAAGRGPPGSPNFTEMPASTVNPLPQQGGASPAGVLQPDHPNYEEQDYSDVVNPHIQAQQDQINSFLALQAGQDPNYQTPAQQLNNARDTIMMAFTDTVFDKLGPDMVYKMTPHQLGTLSAYMYLKLS